MRHKSEAGQALAVTAVALVALIGFAGLGVDMGMLRYEKRLQQTAADAAAIAGANNLAFPANGGVVEAGQNASATNSYTDASGNDLSKCAGSSAAVGTICVQIDPPPVDGPHDGQTGYVEARVSVVQPTYFMKILGLTRETVTARAVATNLSGGPNSGCLYTLGKPSSSIEGVGVQGSAVLNAPTCGIVDNGNFDPTGGALTVNAGSFGAAGDCSGSGCGKGSVTCATPGACPTYGVPVASDPLSYLTPPSQPAASSSCSLAKSGCAVSIGGNGKGKGGGGGGTTILNPGTFTSIDFGANSTTTLNPGIYYINGSAGLTFEGKATITGTGVMFYLTNGATINAVGGGNVPDINLTAPSASNCAACPSEYYGISFYQDPNDTNAPSLGGDNSSHFNGALYFPSVELSFFGNATGFSTGIVVAKALALTGNPTVNLLGTAGLPAGVTLLSHAVLVE